MTVHHNVVWDCGRDGILIKGDQNRVFNNTVLNVGRNSINLHTAGEPHKPWRNQWPLLERQNADSFVVNNCALTITQDNRSTPLSSGSNVYCNFQGEGPKLADPARCDFRPVEDSPLVDAGVEIPGITDGFLGAAPDIGAYEFRGQMWIPGCTIRHVNPLTTRSPGSREKPGSTRTS